MPSMKCGACGSREIGRMSKISRTLRMLMPNVSPARPSVRYCAVSAILSSPLLRVHGTGSGPEGPGKLLALKVRVAIVVAFVHGKGEAAAIDRLGGTGRFRRHRLPGAAIHGGHVSGLGTKLAHRMVDDWSRGGFR